MTKLIKICLWSIAFIPFFVDKMAFFPYVTGENLFARCLIVFISILFIIDFLNTKKFRDKTIEKVKLIIKSPLAISILSFVLIFIISTIFAVNKYNAFWGTIERGEGLIGMIYFFSFFAFSLLIFEKNDWLWFFKINLFASLIISLREFVQFLGGINRPSSFFDNPTFLAGYLLFSILCAVIVFESTISRGIEKVRNKDLSQIIWKYFSITTFILSILGIFATQTRGTIVGLVFGCILVLIYGIVKGKSVSYKKLNLRKISVIIFCVGLIFSTVFIATRKNEIWQKIPGFSRVAVIGSDDATTQTRLLLSKVSLQAVNPIENGLKKFLIGWGPDNVSLAYGRYFNPKQFDYEMKWFDRSHDKLLDTFVMNGLLGLIAYLSIFFLFFRSIFKRKEVSLLNMGLLFFGISLLGHLLFVFDQVTTSIPLFAILSFSLFLIIYNNNEPEKNKKSYEINHKLKIFVGTFFSLLAIFLVFVFFRNDFVEYRQMREYTLFRLSGYTSIDLDKMDSMFEPITPAQHEIRNDLLLFIENNNANDPAMSKLSDIAISKAEEYTNKNPFDIVFLIYLGTVYSKKGNELKNPELFLKGEEYFRRMVFYAPNRPDSNMGLALNLFYEKKYDESFNYSEKAYNISPKYLSEQFKTVNSIYPTFFKYFYETKNKDNFIKTAERLKYTGYISQDMFNQIINYMNKYNSWPKINFTS